MKRWVAIPIFSVRVAMTFSTPHLRASASRRRTSRSSAALTTTSILPDRSGVPESSPVSLSILSQDGPRSIAKSQPFDVPEAHRFLAADDPRPQIAQRSDGRDLIAIRLADLGLSHGCAHDDGPRGRGVVGRPAAITGGIYCDHPVKRLVRRLERQIMTDHGKLDGRGFDHEVGRKL